MRAAHVSPLRPAALGDAFSGRKRLTLKQTVLLVDLLCADLPTEEREAAKQRVAVLWEAAEAGARPAAQSAAPDVAHVVETVASSAGFVAAIRYSFQALIEWIKQHGTTKRERLRQEGETTRAAIAAAAGQTLVAGPEAEKPSGELPEKTSAGGLQVTDGSVE